MVKRKVSNKKVPVSGGMNKNLVVGVVVVLLLVGVFLYFNNQKDVGLMPGMPDDGMPGSGVGDVGDGGTNAKILGTEWECSQKEDPYDALTRTNCACKLTSGSTRSFKVEYFSCTLNEWDAKSELSEVCLKHCESYCKYAGCMLKEISSYSLALKCKQLKDNSGNPVTCDL